MQRVVSGTGGGDSWVDSNGVNPGEVLVDLVLQQCYPRSLDASSLCSWRRSGHLGWRVGGSYICYVLPSISS